MDKDKKKLVETTDKVIAGNSPMSENLSQSLATFTDARDTAFKNAQAEAIASTENSNSKNFKKSSRRNKSQTLIGLAKLQGFMGSKRKKESYG